MKSTMLPLRVLILIVLGTCARGQGPTTPQTRPGRPDPVQREFQRQMEMQMIEQALAEKPSRPVKRYAPPVLEQIRADFLRIQVVERKLTHAASVPAALDLEFVARSAAEIRKRSLRLKKNLALPEVATADRPRLAVEASLEPLRSSLAVLSKLIDEFVSNPLFEESRLTDAQLSAKARRDIEAIIGLSGEIKLSSQKLKAAAKSP